MSTQLSPTEARVKRTKISESDFDATTAELLLAPPLSPQLRPPRQSTTLHDSSSALIDLSDLGLRPAGNRTWSYRCTKRVLDIVGAVLLLILLSPLMLLTLLVLTVTTKGRPIFCQRRVGCCGRSFLMFKFRTMVINAESIRHLIENQQDGPIFKNRRDPRITTLGRWLRSFSVDELPQLVNVLVGDMSLVGPRPPLASEVIHYEHWQRGRLAVKPGLTCLWQVCGRSQIGFDEWVRMDLWYSENQSLWTDLMLLARTPWSVLSRRGAY